MAASEYQIILCDPFGVQLDIIDDWISLRYVRSLNEAGSLSLVLDGNYVNFSFIKMDGRIFVQRNGKFDTEAVWFIREITRALDSNGNRTITIGAVSANELLTRRVVAYAAGTTQASKVGVADDMMKAVVGQNLGASATSARNISTYLTLQANTSLGPSVSKEMSYDNVLDTLREISEATITAGSNVYFDIVATGLTTMEFRTYRGFRGVDHRSPSGLNPVILSPEMGNLIDCTRTYDYSSEYTYVYAGGQSAVYTASSYARINQSPFNLREEYVNVSSTSGSASVQNEANAKVWAGRPKRTFSGKLVDVPGSTEYGIHWGFGDAVTCQFEGEVIDCTIDAVDISVASKKENISATLRVIES